jgi:hypothetical protein
VGVLPLLQEKQGLLGTGHKVTARVGWSDLGWAMKIFGQFRWAANSSVCPRLGHQTKTHVYLKK